MDHYDNNLGEWKDYLYFDPRRCVLQCLTHTNQRLLAIWINIECNRYTRNLVDAGNHRFNVIVLAWSEDQGSPIHDHAGSHCVMKILDGTVCRS